MNAPFAHSQGTMPPSASAVTAACFDRVVHAAAARAASHLNMWASSVMLLSFTTSVFKSGSRPRPAQQRRHVDNETGSRAETSCSCTP